MKDKELREELARIGLLYPNNPDATLAGQDLFAMLKRMQKKTAGQERIIARLMDYLEVDVVVTPERMQIKPKNRPEEKKDANR